jgi:hypothetical protein
MAFIFWIMFLLVPATSINIDRLFCDTFKDQAIYKELNLVADGCSMNIREEAGGMMCLMNPEDNDSSLEMTCKKKEDIYAT